MKKAPDFVSGAFLMRFVRLFVDWVFAAQLGDTGADGICRVLEVGGSQLDEVGNLDHAFLLAVM